MQRIYLLLRNNNEYGPYTIGDLLQQQLRPSDLIWIEGQSQAWCYPSEIPELKAAVSSQAPSERKKTRRMIDAEEELERQAEELRRKVMTSHLHHYNSRTNRNKDQKPHFEPLPFAEGAISFTDHRHDKRWPIGEWISAVMVVVVVGAGIYGGRIIMNSSRWIAAAATRLESSSSHAATAKKTEAPTYTAPKTIQAVDTVQQQVVVNDSIARQDSLARLMAYKHKKAASITPKADTVTDLAQVSTAAPAVTDKHEETTSSQTVTQKPAETEKKDLVTATTKDVKASKDTKDKAETMKTEEAEHKTLGQVIKGIFKKKKKADKQADEDTTSSPSAGN